MFRSHFRQQYSAFCRRLFFPVFLRRRASSESRGGASSSPLSSKHRKKERKKDALKKVRREREWFWRQRNEREREKSIFLPLLSLGSPYVTKNFLFFCSSFSLSLFPTVTEESFRNHPHRTLFWSFFKAPWYKSAAPKA